MEIYNNFTSAVPSLKLHYNDSHDYALAVIPYVVAAGNVGYEFVTTQQSVISAAPALAITGIGNVGIGTTNPAHTLSVAGTIGAQEVIVASSGADYVFDPEYRLQPLDEVATYVSVNHHLPEVPSAAEMKQNGVGVAEMQSKLLAKIEELTLHMIEAEERNKRLESELQNLLTESGELKEKIALLYEKR